MKLGLRIDVASARAAREGVPQLIALLEAAQASATFFFNVGVAHLFGAAWLPGRDMGQDCANAMARVREAGCEAGLLAFDSARWSAHAARASAGWTADAMTRACERYTELARGAPTARAAAGWQMNRHAFRLTQRLGFYYGCDTRGTGPYVPVCEGEIVACLQLPTTLPTLAECLAAEGQHLDDAVARLLAASAAPSPAGHVYAASAGFEGVKRRATFERVLAGWREQGLAPVALAAYADGTDIARLPRHVVASAAVDGARTAHARQDREFLA